MKTFTIRTSIPETGNPFYTRHKAYGGKSGCIEGNGPLWPGSCLPNCVGYAAGRINEIVSEIEGVDREKNSFYYYGPNACAFVDPEYLPIGFQVRSSPMAGSIICWRGGKHGCGHVAVVEEVISDSIIIVSESGWTGPDFRIDIVRRGADGQWREGRWIKDDSYTFAGFIWNPYV